MFGIYYDFQLTNILSPLNDGQNNSNIVNGSCQISCFMINSSLYDISIFRTVTSKVEIIRSSINGSVWIPILILLAIIMIIILLIFILWFINERSKADEMKKAHRIESINRSRSINSGTYTYTGYDTSNLKKRY